MKIIWILNNFEIFGNIQSFHEIRKNLFLFTTGFLQKDIYILNPVFQEVTIMEASMYVKGIYKDNKISLNQKLNIKDGTTVYVEIKTKTDKIEIKEWEFADRDMQDLTPIKVRNLLISCFTYAHIEEALNKKKTRYTFDDYEIAEEGLIAEIKLCFKEINENFNEPTRNSLLKVLNTLAEKQLNRGASAIIINNHRRRLLSVIDKL